MSGCAVDAELSWEQDMKTNYGSDPFEFFLTMCLVKVREMQFLCKKLSFENEDDLQSSVFKLDPVSMKLPMIFVEEVVLVDGFTEAVASELRIAAS